MMANDSDSVERFLVTKMSENRSKSYDHSKLAPHFLGLNSVNVAEPSPVKDFVQSHGGHTVINSVSFLRPLGLSLFCLLTGENLGSHCQQWYCCGERDSFCAKMGI